MDAILICEVPADRDDLRSQILERIAPLVQTGDCALLFVGMQPALRDAPALQIVAAKMKSLAFALMILDDWRSAGAFPDCLTMKVVQSAPISRTDLAMGTAL